LFPTLTERYTSPTRLACLANIEPRPCDRLARQAEADTKLKTFLTLTEEKWFFFLFLTQISILEGYIDILQQTSFALIGHPVKNNDGKIIIISFSN
jgi:hypothetical protein